MTPQEMEHEKESGQIAPVQQEVAPRCPACAAFPKLAARFLDPRSGRTIRLFQCQCGERVWDD